MGLISLILVAAALAAAQQDTPAKAVAILQSQCAQCHSASARMSGLDLTSHAGLLQGGSRGPALGLLLKAVQRTDPRLAMPPTKALSTEDVATLSAWIDAGAKWPATTPAAAVQSSQWWSFKKPMRPAVPRSGSEWVRGPIDEFILAKLTANGLKPASAASLAALARRASYDLTGLPPNQALPDNWEKFVDSLLESPRYGERWGRHWLDLVRYSDTAGFEIDPYIPDAWRYRDYVIDSFNSDKPYDRFIREQLAGDEFFPEDPVANTGTGFFCVGPNLDLYPDQADVNRVQVLTDYVDTTAGVFLGLTAGCARCHDHKFDPIPQRDYFRLQAIFAPAVKVKVALSRLDSLGYEVQENVREIKLREYGDQIAAIQARCKKGGRPTDDEIRACLTLDETARLHALEKKLVAMFANYRPKPFACGVTDVGDFAPRTTIPNKGGAVVPPGFFSALGGGDIPEVQTFSRPTTGPIPLMPTTGRRHALASWLTNPDHPLTARVIVNRVWQYHFGRGIVATPSDFGMRGRAPSHPELLDWLATEFVAQGWSFKKLHRQILLSAAYRQSAGASAEAKVKDPENQLLSHFARRRLDADEIRDSVLSVTGALNLAMGGRPVVPPLSKEELFNMIGRADDSWVVTADARQHDRRGIYMIQKRTFRLPMMETFDAPESMATCPRRDSSTTAPQSLTLLNGPFAVARARAMAAELKGADPEVIAAAFNRILLRAPTPEERQSAAAFLERQSVNMNDRTAAVAELVRGLLNLNEFLYVD